ncbi:MAG: hypothetical protein U7127_28215 [Phormidium sp.]
MALFTPVVKVEFLFICGVRSLEIVNGLVLIWECLEPEEMRDRVEFI